MDIYDESLAFHKKNKGKLEVKSKAPLVTKHDLSLAYTPGVGQVSIEIGKDSALAYDYTLKANAVAVISDGSAILGLGNLGAHAALPVMEGKAILFKEFANIDAFPICLLTQDSEEIIRTVKNISPAFGGINLEDISAPRCFEIEKRLQEELSIPVLHDDQHGTAVVVLAALINALSLAGKDKTARIIINGAGAAGTAVTKLLLKFGFSDIVVADTQGAIYTGRPELSIEKIELAAATNKNSTPGDLATIVREADVFIGLSKGNVLSREMVETMSERAIVFALANPIPEIMPEEAQAGGAYIVATGRSDFANQINNVLAFPGIFRGALDNRVRRITDTMLINAAKNIASYVSDLSPENILPSPLDKNVARVVADAIK